MKEHDMVVYTTTWKKNANKKYTSHVIDVVKGEDWIRMVSGTNMIDAYAASLVINKKVKLRYYLNFATVKEFRDSHVNTGTKKYYS